MDVKDAKKERHNRIIDEAKRRFQACVDAEAEVRSRALDDLRFLSGEQWPQAALAQRMRDNRPALVVNRLDQFVQHISNSIRLNRVVAAVAPVDEKADIKTAETIQGIIRHIEYSSKAHLAYGTGAFYAVAGGFGYWGITTEYSDPLSFDLDIKIRRFANPFQVYLGPHTMPDGSDAKYGFVFADMTREEFEAEYPHADTSSLRDWGAVGDRDGWCEEGKVRVAEYSTIEYAPGVLVKMADGTVKLESDLVDGDVPMIDANGEMVTRATHIPTCRLYTINGVEVLDETVWPIPCVPIVKVIGSELNVDGKTHLKGIVRNLKDAQRQYNFMLTGQTEAVDASKGQIVMYDGQEEGHEAEWRDPSRQKVLRVKSTDEAGNLLPPPSRLSPNLSITHMTEARLMAADDLKALTGIYDAALGAQSNETSGRGITARQQQSELANFHFTDNLTTSIAHSTRMVVDLIGKVYDTRRVLRIIGEDESQQLVTVNEPFERNGESQLYDLRVGRYDVICTSGPSFHSKRQEAAQLLTQLAAAAPVMMNAAPDLIVQAYDVPYAKEIAERLKRTLPPGIADEEGQPKVPPQVAQQMQQMGQMVQALSKELDERTRQMESQKQQLDSRERIEMAKIESNERIASAELNSQEAIAALRADIERMKAQIGVSMQQIAQDAQRAAQTIE